ncbi:LPXTG cell wall anchor domain-containing protein, partial [Lacticaseibacillus paracasei]
FKETAAPKNIEASQNLVVVMSSNLQHGNQSRIDLFPKNKMVSSHTDAPKKVPKKTRQLLPQTGDTVAAWLSTLGLIIFATVLAFNMKKQKIDN